AGGEEGVPVGYRHDPVDDAAVVGLGPEVLADALHQIRPPVTAGVHRPLGVGADDLDGRVLRLQILANAADRAAGADAGHEVCDPPGCLAPDLGPGAAYVRRRVLSVAVLVGLEGAGDLLGQAVGHRVVRLRI